MEKEFVSYKQAVALKELGFGEKCFNYATSHTDASGRTWTSNLSAPLKQQVFRWFRDKKLCDGSVCRHGEADGGYSYRWDIVYEYGVYEERHFKQGYKTYEEAEKACIDKLIELVKQQDNGN